MPGCVVKGCSSKSGYSFPTDPELNRKWRIAVRGEDMTATTSTDAKKSAWRPTLYSQVCGNHFKPEDFQESMASMYSTNSQV